jgi:4'-phosphopantetheinyl transferase
VKNNEVTAIQFHKPQIHSWELENRVHVWRFPLIKIPPALLDLEEISVSERYRFEDDRNRFVNGRQALKVILSRYLSVSATDISIADKTNGKPFIQFPKVGLQFNISHSGEWILIALCDSDIGVDVEKVNPIFHFDDLIQVYFDRVEKELVVSAENAVLCFYNIWTRKEALIKAWGTGLSTDIKEVKSINDDYGMDDFGRPWKIRSFYVDASHSAAVAYGGGYRDIFYFDGADLLSAI